VAGEGPEFCRPGEGTAGHSLPRAC
jgi:hypothetical protein